MAEPLVVDTSRLETSGATLQDLAFPMAPAPIAFAGTDSVSAAVNKTLPIIESPVVEGLPAAKAAVTRTGSSIAAAAGIYSDTDQRLGDHVDQVQFLAADETSAGGASADRLAVASTVNAADGETPDQPADAETPTPQPDSTLTPGSVVPQLGQYAQTAGYATQNMQSLQGAAGSMPTSGAPPAQPAADSSQTAPDDQAQLVDDKEETDDEEPQPETPAEGAAAGDQASGGAPIKPTTAGQPETMPSEVEL